MPMRGFGSVFRVRLIEIKEKAVPDGESPYQAPLPIPALRYLSGRNVQPDQPLYDDTWGEVILLCGLPGTGKDTWIAQHHPGMPMVSLDDLRAEL